MREYARLVRRTKIYTDLLSRLRAGRDICIVEVDVPAYDKKGLWSTKGPDNIKEIDIALLDQLLDDPRYPFGHGLVLAKCLLEDL